MSRESRVAWLVASGASHATMELILASASPRRLDLLRQIGITPARIVAPDIPEHPLPGELPEKHAERLARAKAETVAAIHPHAAVLAADTVVACGRRILPKAETPETARGCLSVISGRRHRVITSVCLITPTRTAQKTVTTLLKCKRLTVAEVDAYIGSGEWQGKAGGYAIQGHAAAFFPWISGSHSAVVGLPLAETYALLTGCGAWKDA